MSDRFARVAGFSRSLAVGLVVSAVLLVLLEGFLRVIWHFAGPRPSDGTVVARNLFAPDAGQTELPPWFWNAMAPAQRSNIVGNAMAYPDEDFIFRVRPNPTGAPVRGFGGIDELGFRTAHLDARSAIVGNPLRILLLGDSCAWGWGIRRFSDTMPPLIEQRLAESGIDGAVVNLAEPGFTTTQGLRLFTDWFPKIRPQFVVLQYGWNDRRNSRGFTDRQVMRMMPMLHSRPAKWVMKTALYRTFAWTAAHLLPEPQNPAYHDRDLDPVVDNARMRVPLAESIDNYRQMIDAAKKAGARVLIILPPYRPSVSGLGPRIKDFHREVAAAFQGEATFLALPAMREPSPDLDTYFDVDGIHPNMRGARYIADAIASQIALSVRSNGTVVEAAAPAASSQSLAGTTVDDFRTPRP